MYVQDDNRWGNLLWYDKKLSQSFRRITKCIHVYTHDQTHAQQLINAAERLCEDINVIVKNGQYNQTTRHSASLAQSGCWHTSVANVFMLFNIKLEGRDVTPQVILEAFQKHMLGTLTGYVEIPFVEPLSIISGSKVQLIKYRDFGSDGTHKHNKEFLALLSTTTDKNICAIVNVNDHEFEGHGNSHYVLVTKPNAGGYGIQDPGWPVKISLFGDYKKYYQISVYQKIKG